VSATPISAIFGVSKEQNVFLRGLLQASCMCFFI